MISPPPKRSYQSSIRNPSVNVTAVNLLSPAKDNYGSPSRRREPASPALMNSRRSNFIDPDEISLQLDDPFGDGGSLFSPDVAVIHEALNSASPRKLDKMKGAPMN